MGMMGAMAMTVQALRRAISATFSRSRLRPELLMITAQSPGYRMAALLTCVLPSPMAVAVTPKRINLRRPSCATVPELPTP